MAYSIFYTNRVESNEIKVVNTIEEAKAFCESEVKGEEIFTGDDNDKVGFFKYEVYDLDNFDPESEYITDKEPVYETEMYWMR